MICQFIGEVFSFHATQFANAFKGGIVTTNDGRLASRLRLMKSFGFSGYDQVSGLGINSKMNEVSAAMGLCSIKSAAEIVAHDRASYERYQQRLMTTPGVSLFRITSNEPRNYQYVVLEIDESIAGISRDPIVIVLQAERVLARRCFYPGCHDVEPYPMPEECFRRPTRFAFA
jgi:dTDP-4-amino-4,6-dideoxygalactose transaminase